MPDAIDFDPSIAADIDGAQFAALEQMAYAERLADRGGDFHRPSHGPRAPDEDTVDMAVSELERIARKYPLDKEMAAKPRRIERLRVFTVNGLPELHVVLHLISPVPGVPVQQVQSTLVVPCKAATECTSCAPLKHIRAGFGTAIRVHYVGQKRAVAPE
jgi:hypothetical protein